MKDHSTGCVIFLMSFGLLMVCGCVQPGDKWDLAVNTSFWENFVSAVQKADPREVEEHLDALCEATHFFAALLSTNALPSVPKEAHGEFTVLPSSTNTTRSFAVSYPFTVGVDLTLTDAAVGTQVYILEKCSHTGTWAVVKGWRYTTDGQSIGRTVLPSQGAQEAANRTAAEEMKSFHER